ncbi:MAG: PBP1A family penicillin-binding protein [Hyphomicrobiales bacterium]|nr:PBP1A family penicillin-binding protein [Hyphomicrobiales bacterium]
MAMARGKAQNRREPVFRDERDDLRVSPDDRVSQPARGRPAAPAWDTDDGEPPERSASKTKRPNPAARRGAKGSKKKHKRSFFGRLVYWGFVVSLWGGLAVAGVVGWYAAHLPAMSELEVPERPPNISIVGTSGDVLVDRGAMGAAVKLAELPKHLPRAVIAIEDRRFYRHLGIDPLGIARAAVRNLMGRGVSEGGSTLTQQLAKNIFLTSERTFGRKIQEMILALWLEARFSKNEIIEMYLNRVYLGAGAYGVEAAAQRYFGKSARAVSLQEAAILAGLLRAPSRYAPSRNPKLAIARAKTVLNAMVEEHYISDNEARIAGAGRPSVKPADAAGSSINYAADWVMDLLPTLIGTIDSDIVVETTIDANLQREAEKALRETLDKDGGRYQVSQGAVVSVDVNGAVRALVGGKTYSESPYNRAVVARRQPGSAFKPFVYLTALERGLAPDTAREDAPITIKGWSPENYSRDYRGPVSLRDALALSLNTVAVRLGVEAGPANVVRTAQRLGIASPLQANPSLALGTSDVSVLELTRAYAAFANGGFAVPTYVVKSIRTAKGRVLFDHLGDGGKRVIRPEQVAQMNDMLARAVDIGTARNARVPGWPVAGKTGTSQDFRDAWFVGYSAQMVTGVWLGNDDGTPTKRASGGGLPTAIWSRVMGLAHRGLPAIALPGAGQPLREPDQPAPHSIDEILLGRNERQSPPRSAGRPTAAPCQINADFLRCLFGG